jgi:hypothetical protein
MSVDDLHSFAADKSRQLCGSYWIELPPWCAGKDSQPELGRAQRQRLAGTGRNHTLISGTSKRIGEPQDLPLATTPTALGIDVEHRDRRHTMTRKESAPSRERRLVPDHLIPGNRGTHACSRRLVLAGVSSGPPAPDWTLDVSLHRRRTR